MKRILVLMLVISAISFGYEKTDGKAGATEKKKDLKKEYNELMKSTKKIIKENNWFLREENFDKIEMFIKELDAEKSDKDFEKMKDNMKTALVKLENVDGIGGASLNPKLVMGRYEVVKKLFAEKDKNAVREAEDLIKFIDKWKASQSSAAQGHLENIEKDLDAKIKELKK